jgi:phage terminase large subunit-like protein
VYFDQAKADRAIKFIRHLRHTKGKWKGVPFTLLPWQEQALTDVFGTLRDSGIRQYNTAYLEVCKKQGKSELGAGIALQGLCADDEWAAEVYGCAADRAQASIIFDVAVDMVDQDPALKKRIKPVLSQKRLVYLPTKSFYQVLSAEAYCLHPDTIIDMADGSRKMASTLYAGQMIIGWDGEKLTPAKIESVEEQPPSPVYRIKTHRSREIIVTGEHPFLTMINGRRSQDLTHKYQWSKAKDLKINDRIKIALNWPEMTSNMSALEAWAAGAWAGDGECGRFRFINIDEKIINEMNRFMQSIGSCLVSNYSTRQKQKGAIGGPCHEHHVMGRGKRTKSPGREWVRKHFGQESRAYNKRIPEAIFKGGPVAWAAFLAGWMDTDGCVPITSHMAKWSSCSDNMLKDGQSLLARFGINATIAKNNLHVSGLAQLKTLYSAIAPYMKNGNKKYKLAIKTERTPLSAFNAHVADRIVSIEILSPIKTISLEVKNIQTHITNGMITHNTKHGLNVSRVIFDEVHAQPNRGLYDVMTEGSGDARVQPLYVFLTTAGDDPDRETIGWELHQMAVDVLMGLKVDPTFYAMLYGIDRDNNRIWTGRDYCVADKIDWQNEEVWRMVNPSIDHTVPMEKVRDQYTRAKGNLSREKNFRWLRLNSWEKIKTSKWIPLEAWDASADIVIPERLAHRPCYGGLDLSSSIDLTAFALAFPPTDDDPLWRALWRFYIPEDNFKERVRRDGVAYDRWIKEGYIKTTPGNVVDYAFIREDIKRQRDLYDIREIGFDPWHALQLSIDLTDDGLTMAEVRQGYKTMSPAMKLLEKLILGQQIAHGGNPVARWNFSNLEVKIDENENIRPVKGKSIERIDGIVALIDALARAAVHENKTSVYENPDYDLVVL